MTRFEEKLIEREAEKEEQKKLNEAAEEVLNEMKDEFDLDLEAGAKSLLGLDKDENKLLQNYNKNMAGRMMDEFHSFEEHLDEMGGKAFPDDLTF